jgi:hypothetical protein
MIVISFIVLATVIMIIKYDRKTFIVQATGEGATTFSPNNNRTTNIRHLYKKTTVLSCHRCLINTGIKKRTTLKYTLEFLPEDVSK